MPSSSAASLLAEAQHLLDGGAVLVLQPPHHLKPVLDLLQAAGVHLHAVPVRLQGVGQFLRLDDERFGVVPKSGHGWVHLRKAGHCLLDRAQAVHRGRAGLALVESVVGLGGQIAQPLGVGRDGPLGLKLLVLAGLQARRGNLVSLVAQQVGAARLLAVIAPKVGELLPRGT